jgi:hypothetical protein
MMTRLCFILIQGEILDIAETPAELHWSFVDHEKDFSVKLGIVKNNKHQSERPIAAYNYRPEGFWNLTSPMDGYKRLVGRAEPATEVIRDRLQALYKAGDFDKPDKPFVLLECM